MRIPGTFNPIHNAHLSMANYAKNVYDYDHYIVYTCIQTLLIKSLTTIWLITDFRWFKQAVSGENFFAISNIEVSN